MKKVIALVLAMVCMLSLFGCQSNKPVSVSIKDNVTTVSVIYFHGAKEDKWNIEGEELNALKDWVANLNNTDVEQPEIADGAQEYKFSMIDNEFSYIINGQDEHYLKIGDKWLAVSNPSHPPITSPVE